MSMTSSTSLNQLLDFHDSDDEFDATTLLADVSNCPPRYRRSFGYRLSPMRRYHPYPRFPSIIGEPEPQDEQLLDTIYPGESIALNTQPQEQSPSERLEEIFRAVERVVYKERRAQLLPLYIVDFAAGLMRAQNSVSVGGPSGAVANGDDPLPLDGPAPANAK